jgi:hypothetical protein
LHPTQSEHGVRDIICTVLPWLALLFALLGMRDLNPAIPVGMLTLILLVWAIRWQVHHIPLRWLRYLRSLFWVFVVGAIIVVPELRAAFEEFVRSLLSLQSSTLIVLALVILIAWAVLCLARPAQQTRS